MYRAGLGYRAIDDATPVLRFHATEPRAPTPSLVGACGHKLRVPDLVRVRVCVAVRSTIRRRKPMLMLALALTALAVSFSRAPTASADVCTGGAPYQGSGSPPHSLLAAVPFLKNPRWSKESLPQWSDTALLA
jgi:hypothetical protein